MIIIGVAKHTIVLICLNWMPQKKKIESGGTHLAKHMDMHFNQWLAQCKREHLQQINAIQCAADEWVFKIRWFQPLVKPC